MDARIEGSVMELIHELGLMTVNELQELRSKWIEKIKAEGSPDFVLKFCDSIMDLVIQKKQEKNGGGIRR